MFGVWWRVFGGGWRVTVVVAVLVLVAAGAVVVVRMTSPVELVSKFSLTVRIASPPADERLRQIRIRCELFGLNESNLKYGACVRGG